jgi:CRISPR-associated protein Cas4
MISVTDISSYMYCQRKFYLNKVLNIKEPVKEVMVKGSIKHHSHDLANKNEKEIILNIDEIDKEIIEKIYKKYYSVFLREAIKKYKKDIDSFGINSVELFSEMWEDFEKDAQQRASQVFDFASFSNFTGEKLWEHFYPKIESELWIESQELQLRGIIDRIEMYPNKKVPVELKTGKAPSSGVWPGHQIQIGAYIMLMQEKFSDLKINEGFIHYTQENKKNSIILNPFLKQKIITLAKEVEEMMKSDKIPQICKSEGKCNCCGIKNTCYGKS